MKNYLQDTLLMTAGLVEKNAPTESILDDMMQDLAVESAMDEAFLEMDTAAMTAALEGATYFFETLADREASLESMAGKDIDAIYSSFGLEAARDVLKRKAYVGIAAIKALIAAIIGWFKNLLGFSATSKKVFISIAKKADKELKELQKVRTKDHSKAKRKVVVNLSERVDDVFSDIDTYGKVITAAGTDDEASLKSAEEKLAVEKGIKGYVDFKNKEEKEGSALFDLVLADIKMVYERATEFKDKDFSKEIKEKIKKYEDLLKALDKKEEQNEDDVANRTAYNKTLSVLRQYHGFMRDAMKIAVTLADQCLINAKAFRASL